MPGLIGVLTCCVAWWQQFAVPGYRRKVHPALLQLPEENGRRVGRTVQQRVLLQAVVQGRVVQPAGQIPSAQARRRRLLPGHVIQQGLTVATARQAPVPTPERTFNVNFLETGPR